MSAYIRAKLAREDRTLPMQVLPVRFCPRKIPPGGVKRYMHSGPLFGFILGCPACGFIEQHEHAQCDFEEAGGQLVGAGKPPRCMACRRWLVISPGTLAAVSQPPA